MKLSRIYLIPMLAFVVALTGCSQTKSAKTDNSDSNVVIETILARHSVRSYKTNLLNVRNWNK